MPYTVMLWEDAKPYAVSAPRRIPLPLMDKVKEELDRLESLDVIKCVTEPSDWCATIVVVPKKDSEGSQKVRICVDYTELNKAVKRERHILPSVDHTLGQLAGVTLYSKLDANCGFHQVKLSN